MSEKLTIAEKALGTALGTTPNEGWLRISQFLFFVGGMSYLGITASGVDFGGSSSHYASLVILAIALFAGWYSGYLRKIYNIKIQEHELNMERAKAETAKAELNLERERNK